MPPKAGTGARVHGSSLFESGSKKHGEAMGSKAKKEESLERLC